MTPQRVAAGLLSTLLGVLLIWAIMAGVGDFRTWLMLGMGTALGALYTTLGRLPAWIIDHSGGSLADDNDPSNISPRFYLPAIGLAILVATIALLWGLVKF